MTRRRRRVGRGSSPLVYLAVGLLAFAILAVAHQRLGTGDDSAQVPRASGTASAALAELPIAPSSTGAGYSRERFGEAWADVDGNGCDTRNDVLARDLTGVVLKANGCTVLSGRLADPYTGKTIAFTHGAATSPAVQIDHVVALENAWRSGAATWTAQERLRFANDPLNLLAVDGPTNQEKGSADASRWLPPSEAYRCRYVARQVAVKTAYGLTVTADEHDAMVRVLEACPTLRLP